MDGEEGGEGGEEGGEKGGEEGGGGRGIQLDGKKSPSGDKTGDMWSIMWLSSDLGCVSLRVSDQRHQV